MSLTEKITDFETKGLSWLEPAREFVKSLNQAANLIQTDNLSELPTFLKNIGSNHILRNREFLFAPKNPYNLVAERRVSRREALTFPTWCPGWDSNPQGFWPQHFKCCVYTVPPPGHWRPRRELHPRMAVLQTAVLAASPRGRKSVIPAKAGMTDFIKLSIHCKDRAIPDYFFRSNQFSTVFSTP